MICVDKLREYPPSMIAPAARHAGRKWAHLWSSDNNESELLLFARRIKLRPEWIQRSRPDFIHFDLVPSRRRAAVMNGAVEKDLLEWVSERRTQGCSL